MTHDFKSVKSWSAQLLRSTANKWVFMLFINVSNEVKNISKHMNKTLTFVRETLVKTWKQIMKQANKHRKEINYEIESKIFLDERNIVTARLFKKLNNKMLNSFNMLNSVDFSYKLKLSETMHIHDVFHFKLLHFIVNNLLPDQKNNSSELIMINEENEWKINNILNSQWY